MKRKVVFFTIVLLALQIVIAWMPALRAQNDEKVKFTATYKIEKDKRNGKIVLVCEMKAGHHIYSTTQKSPPGPPPTKIKIAKSDDFKLTGKFAANKKPKVIEKDPIFDARIEEHYGKVTFSAPFDVAEDVDVEELKVAMKFNGQVCSEVGCIPIFGKKLKVRFAGYYDKNEEEKKEKEDQRKDEDSTQETKQVR